MQVTQSYSRPSSAKTDNKGTKFSFSAELSRKPVSINAMILNSLGYARIMLALRQIVKGDWRTPQKDHTAYQEWVNERYVEQLPAHLKHIEAKKVAFLAKREALKAKKAGIIKMLKPLQAEVEKARRQYYNWLYQNDRDKWYVLDPVISVHKDSVIFEAFSLDESAYGRVSVPMKNLEVFNEIDYGTTNIDFSQALADEIYRVRNYRPAWLKVEYDKVELSTAVGSNVEKKIDLPESWVRGFLQVQSASTLEGTYLDINSQTLAKVLEILAQKKEKESPRSLRFILKKGEKIKIIIDPWNIEIIDTNIFEGENEGEIRLWGRRRLMVLADLLPYTDKVNIKLLGTGMPSYWSVELDGHRFDVGLSGWTDNDWAKKGNFDLLASANKKVNIDIKKVEQILIKNLSTNSKEVAEIMNVDRSAATSALQELCKNGQAMYDHLTQSYRWRQLLKQDIKLTESEEDERLKYAIELIQNKQVEVMYEKDLEKNIKEYKVGVQGKNLYQPVIQLDLDGRIKSAECTCSHHRRNKLRQGPCAHIMSAVIWIGKNN
ncbi:MAG: hypothetical protein EAZ85_12950 [Bacteroidetes bacterium]|nr:MAG: hypothetical protein EAZ85_12950 [Bacteroidota bacterium]TAG92990.1 MAG: hypothetical protein EAZ20_02080 [Bacteroidota bacterium]